MKISKELKIRLLRDLQRGELNLFDYPEFNGERDREIDAFLDSLSEEEKQALLAIGRRDD